MTDNEIIKTLEEAEYKVDGVVMRGFYLDPESFNKVIDLINRLQAENEALINGQETLLKNLPAVIRDQAYKRFADAAIALVEKRRRMFQDYYRRKGEEMEESMNNTLDEFIKKINHLLNELVGEQK